MKKLLTVLLFMGLVPLAAQAEPYQFKPEDTLELYVFDVPELTGEFVVDADGFIRLPLVGMMSVAGLTEAKLLEVLKTEIGPYYADPKITITPRFTVIVMGHVSDPGVYTITRDQHFLKIIAEAGGFGLDSSGDIRVIRDGEGFNIKGDKLLYGSGELIAARSGDVIIVKRKLITRTDFTVALSTLTAFALIFFY